MESEARAWQPTDLNSKLFSTPATVEDAGLPRSVLVDIVSRQLKRSGDLELNELSLSTALSGSLLTTVIGEMRQVSLLQLLSPRSDGGQPRFSLTDAGKTYASQAFERSGYVGPAPISVVHYCALIERQSVRSLAVRREDMEQVFAGVVIKSKLKDQLGAALHSGKAMFIYGPAGTGKTYICSRLGKLARSPVQIPHAIYQDGSIIKIFDPSVHQALDDADERDIWLPSRPDPRLVLCHRPFIVSGGELTMDLLEVQYDVSGNQYSAPMQLKATNGMYMIDDLGRQKMSVDALFNRWIVPMESKFDYLSTQGGARMQVPFDVTLIFSTNLAPEDVCDPAFQRRIGHKIRFEEADAGMYEAIWQQECERRHVPFDRDVAHFAIQNLHSEYSVPMLACHPRDLVGMALDYSLYADGSSLVTVEGVRRAWDNYFLSDSNIT